MTSNKDGNALPEGGPEREIFLRALRAFSDSCEDPELTPSCPFYRADPSGPWCMEECMDLLAKHGPVTESRGVFLGGDLRASPLRHRARRDTGQSRKPFDAAETALEDKPRPMEQWRPTTLLRHVIKLVQIPSDSIEIRRNELRNVVDVLSRQGFDFEVSILPVMATDLSIIISAFTASPEQEIASHLSSDVLDNFRLWRTLLTRRQPPSENASVASEGDPDPMFLLPQVVAWFRSNGLDAIVDWRVPTDSQFWALSASEDPLPSAHCRWVMDRFTKTYLDEWHVESLDLEWDYLHGNIQAPCHNDAMRSRRVSKASLAEAIAYRKHSEHSHDPDRRISVGAMVWPALEHLRAGRRSTAAALFDACRRAAPNSKDANNNYGFCLIHDDPSGALVALETAASLAESLEAVNVANRAFCLWRLGRLSAALELAERFIESEPRPSAGWLWDYRTDQPKICDVASVTDYVCSMALKIAEEAEDDPAAKFWRKQLALQGKRPE